MAAGSDQALVAARDDYADRLGHALKVVDELTGVIRDQTARVQDLERQLAEQKPLVDLVMAWTSAGFRSSMLSSLRVAAGVLSELRRKGNAHAR